VKKEKTFDFGRLPSSFIYQKLAIPFLVPVVKKFFRIHVQKDSRIPDLKGPIVCIGQHPSYLDPFFAALLFGKRRINFVAGTFLFRSRFFGSLFNKIGVIPKTQFRSDAKALKAMLTVLKRDGILGIFPEATRFVDGTTCFFDDAIARLIKKTGASVVCFRTHGAYSTWPRWSTSGIRRGHIEVGVHRIISSEEAGKMTADELHTALLEAVQYNEYDWLREHPHTYKNKKITAGAEFIACICPSCQKQGGIYSDKNRLICSHCGNTAVMNSTGFLQPESEKDKSFPDLHQWVLWEKDLLDSQIHTPSYHRKCEVWLLQLKGEYEYKILGEGHLSLSQKGVSYIGTEAALEDGISLTKEWKKKLKKMDRLPEEFFGSLEEKEKDFKIAKIRGVVAQYGKYLELIESGGITNRFIVKDPYDVLPMQLSIQIIRDLLSEEENTEQT